MTKTVLYYNRGNKCCLRLVVSLYTLRKVYTGNILIILEGEQPKWFLKVLEKFNVETKKLPDSKTKNTLNVKSSLWRYSDYDLTMFMDSDTVVLRPIDAYFTLIQQHGFVTGKFANWVTDGSKIKSRIQQWSKVLPKETINGAIKYGVAINTGINGWVKDNQMLEKWENMCALGATKKCSDRVADEIACQILLHSNAHTLAGVEWGTSVKYGIETPITKIIHYHGQKHVENFSMCKYWKSAYMEMVRKGILEEGNRYEDRRLHSWITPTPIYPLTNVTAVNKLYLKKFANNFIEWMKLDYFKDHPMIVFAEQALSSSSSTEALTDSWTVYTQCRLLVENYKNVTVIPIRPNDKNLSTREYMLSTFVFDVAKYVKTKYWAKVDCDCTPTGEPIVLDKQVFKSTMTAHKWGYTKVKSDEEYENTGEHWCHKLDRLCNDITDFRSTKELFKGKIADGLRMSHKRVCTFFSIEKTAWTKHMAQICIDNNNGRMLIPSQDTMSHYMITRLGNGRTVRRENFKRFFTP